MKRTTVTYGQGFHVLIGDEHSQAATLVVEPGGKVGGAHNRHGGADQWIYVLSGKGEATVAGETFAIAPGALVLIQRGDGHGFRNTGSANLEMLTLYVPPAYDENEDELPAGMP